MAALYGFGAGAAQTIEEVLARRLAWEKFRAAQEAENRRLAVMESGEAREADRYGVERPALESKTRVALATEPAQIEAPGLVNEGTRTRTQGQRLENASRVLANVEQADVFSRRTPEMRDVMAQPEPWQKFAPMPGGASPFDRENKAALQRIHAQGAVQASMQGPYISQWDRQTTDDKGRPVTKRFGQLRDGTIIEIQSIGGKTTADIQNRKAYTQEFAKTLSTFEAMIPFVSNYKQTDPTFERVLGAMEGAAEEFLADTPLGPALKPQETFFMRTQKGLSMTGARVLGSNSQLSDMESKRAEQSLFPKLTEPEELQYAKIQFWKRASEIEDEFEQAQYIRMGLQGLFPGIGGQQIVDPFTGK